MATYYSNALVFIYDDFELKAIIWMNTTSETILLNSFIDLTDSCSICDELSINNETAIIIITIIYLLYYYNKLITKEQEN